MKIALAQLNYTIGDIDGNTSKIIDSINKAKAQRADLVIFAEQAVSGTPAFDLLRKTTFLELCEDALVEIASCCDGIAAIVGLPILTREGTISAAAPLPTTLSAMKAPRSSCGSSCCSRKRSATPRSRNIRIESPLRITHEHFSANNNSIACVFCSFVMFVRVASPSAPRLSGKRLFPRCKDNMS